MVYFVMITPGIAELALYGTLGAAVIVFCYVVTAEYLSQLPKATELKKITAQNLLMISEVKDRDDG